MALGHSRDTGLWCVAPGTEAIHNGALGQNQGFINGARGVCRGITQGAACSPIGLEKRLDSSQSLQNKLVARIELDAWFTIDAFGTKLGAQPALGARAVASRFSRSAYFALCIVRSLVGNEWAKTEWNIRQLSHGGGDSRRVRWKAVFGD